LGFEMSVDGDIEWTNVCEEDAAGAMRRAEIVLPGETPAMMELESHERAQGGQHL
jgi:hypothetical protein